MNETCTRCDNTVSRQRPCCSNCGTWLPWGDQAVAKARQERRAKYEEQERKIEHGFQVLRRAPEARIISAEPLALRFLRFWHLGQFTQARKLAVCAAVVASVTASATIWAIAPDRPSQSASRARKGEILKAVCNDGTVLEVSDRRGACSGRDGVEKFISETT